VVDFDILHKNFQEDQLNSRRFPGFPGRFLNSRRFQGFPGFRGVVDTLLREKVKRVISPSWSLLKVGTYAAG